MEPPGQLTLFTLSEEQTFSECALFHSKKRGAAREGPARDLNLEKRDIYRTETKRLDWSVTPITARAHSSGYSVTKV